MTLPFTLLSLLLALPAYAASDNCYWRSSNTIQAESVAWYACNNTQVRPGGAQLCCLNGAECGEDSICFMPGSTNGNQYFVGGCTDGTYGDPVCRSSCTGDAQTWVQYNTTASRWQCCGSGACLGNITSQEMFQAVSPTQWSAVPTAQTSSSAASSSTASSTASATASSTPASSTATPSASSSSTPIPVAGLSTGAQAGIGVGSAAGGIAILAAIVFCILRRRRSDKDKLNHEERWQSEQQRQQQGMMQTHDTAAPYYHPDPDYRGVSPATPPKPAYAPQELVGDGFVPHNPQELPGTTYQSNELPGQGVKK